VREACYCGRVGEVEDREPAYGGAGRVEALRCPRCGHLDPLPQLDADDRRAVYEEAERRALEGLARRACSGDGYDRAAR